MPLSPRNTRRPLERNSRSALALMEFSPGIHIDVRRAAWLPETQTLAIADLHLGYVWAHRHSGQMLPLSAMENTVSRIGILIDEYKPKELVLLGDIVHRAVPVPALESELRQISENLGSKTELRWIAGNHDTHLAILLRKLKVSVELLDEHQAGPHLLVHGDSPSEVASVHISRARSKGGKVIFGHEHPTFTLTDRIASSIKCPCFAGNKDLLVLPAFSEWAAGSDIRRHSYLSHYLQLSPPARATVCVGDKLLPIQI